MITIAVVSQKGGTGKSTTALNIAAKLQAEGNRVLLIDLDPQGNTTYNTQANEAHAGAYELLTGATTAAETIQTTATGFNIIAAREMIATLDSCRADTLKEALKPIARQYDYCIIDDPPQLGTVVINALTAATTALIVAQPSIYSLQGIVRLYDTVQSVKAKTNSRLYIVGILLTRYNGRTTATRILTDTLTETAKQYDTKLLNTYIRDCTAIVESQIVQQDIFAYAPRSNAAQDYTALTDEIIKILKGE